MPRIYNLKLTETEKAYIAGFVDGEGCIGVRNGGPLAGRNGKIRLQIGNTNEEVLTYIRDIIGFGSLYLSKEAGRYAPKCKAIYTYEVSATQCKAVLEAILPYLIVKKKQANLALEYAETTRPGCHLTDELRQRQIELKELFKQLNKRGI